MHKVGRETDDSDVEYSFLVSPQEHESHHNKQDHELRRHTQEQSKYKQSQRHRSSSKHTKRIQPIASSPFIEQKENEIPHTAVVTSGRNQGLRQSYSGNQQYATDRPNSKGRVSAPSNERLQLISPKALHPIIA
ncbi:MAG: hypothetical protein EZS28_037206 [Streblomastix strix]|uniref:Uncharacterized protein n=1 Tax=Streblomastix strix TaxID=222440 RepID=A0A5J4U9L0_9EUKA|nr:MAG: hypothetical protein EZS28_037206 [Streblomastix strix]